MAVPEALDLFCGAGGASAGLVNAGFAVLGVDNRPQPRYPYAFYLEDALSVLCQADYLANFPLVWASPPCQGYSRLAALGHHWCLEKLIPQVRHRLQDAGVDYVMENVPGSPLEEPILLCGAMFGLRTYRHRLFEFSPRLRKLIRQPLHPYHAVRTQLCSYNRHDPDKFVSVYGKVGNADLAREVLGVPWMTGTEASQCVPPVYATWCAEQVRKAAGF